MTPLYEDPWFSFHFAADRLIPRFHLKSVQAGERVEVFKIVTPAAGSGWVCWRLPRWAKAARADLSEPIIMRAGEAFIAVPVGEK